ncbi:NUMOD4 domain-containing protein [Acinetobacter pittii]|uniref:NUMOD4 domain-containing protein n=1 Tax=Acinetobacter pittii TaxID=48296 RepID=UPI0024DE1C9F|nr:NUMOD4 domain-containing protein [Acinetobacter pittii]
MEIWKPIVGYEGIYEVSNLGCIKSLSRATTNKLQPFVPERILKTRIGKTGYEIVGLSKDGGQKTCKVHRLVASAFCDNPLNKPHINHKNGLKTDNNSSNLEWVTASENALHALSLGLFQPSAGENSKAAKITAKQANYVREQILNDIPLNEISASTNIPLNIVSSIRLGKTWVTASTPELVQKCREYKKPRNLYHSIKHSEDFVLSIINRLLANESVSSIARDLKLQRGYVSMINNGKTRAEVIPACGSKPPYLKNNFVMSAKKDQRKALKLSLSGRTNTN